MPGRHAEAGEGRAVPGRAARESEWSLSRISVVGVRGANHLNCRRHGYGKRFIVHTDEDLTALTEPQSAIRDATGRIQSAILIANLRLSLLSTPS